MFVFFAVQSRHTNTAPPELGNIQTTLYSERNLSITRLFGNRIVYIYIVVNVSRIE